VPPADDPQLRQVTDALTGLPNDELLAGLDLMLLELERRLLRYATRGSELRTMADEGLVLAMRASARLRQAQSAASHTVGHLQVVGVGTWQPASTNPAWSDDPRVVEDIDVDNPDR
jgi:hypothetical protein